MFKVLGSYRLPKDIMFSGNFSYQKGYPLDLRLYVRGFNQGTFYVRPAERGTYRMDNILLLDLRAAEIFDITEYHKLEVMLDVYNLLNNNVATEQNTTVGSSLFKPIEIMTPRTIRVGARFSF